MELLARMKQRGKSWAFYVFSSANAIRKYTMRRTGGIGRLLDVDGPGVAAFELYASWTAPTRSRLTRELRAARHQAARARRSSAWSTTPRRISRRRSSTRSRTRPISTSSCCTRRCRARRSIRRCSEQGRLLEASIWRTSTGSTSSISGTPAISRDESKKFLDWAFRRDFERNGPSMFRVCRTTLQGWKRYKDHPDPRIRRRFCHEAKALKWSYSGLLWAMERMLRPTNESVAGQIRELRDELRREFGLATMLSEWLLGPLMLATAKREERRLANGITYEPKAMIERTNWVGDTDSAVLPESIGSVFRPDYALSNIVPQTSVTAVVNAVPAMRNIPMR